MKSHEYKVSRGDLARLAARVLGPIIVFAVLMRLGALNGLWPSPWPALDLDRTILLHQANASRNPNDSNFVVIGDSSCLMDVSAVKLAKHLEDGYRPLNLGTFMYLGLGGYASMLERYNDVNPGRARIVVLLVHPEMLRGIEAVSSYLLLLSDVYAGSDPSEPNSPHGQLCGLLGLNIFQSRFLARCPLPLPGQFGRFYGFNLDLYDYMERARGSAVDPHQYVPAPGQGDAEYRLAPALESACLAFRAAVPPGAKLLVGLTPVPESFVAPNYPHKARQILLQFGKWLHADCLTNLPPTLPDALFASTTHLNRQGSETYTGILAERVEPHLRAMNGNGVSRRLVPADTSR
jgi:hypothetical protein